MRTDHTERTNVATPRASRRAALMAGLLSGIPAMALATDVIPSGGQFQVNSYTTGTQPGTYGNGHGIEVSSDGAGGFVVVWGNYGSNGSDTSGSSVQARRFDGTGTPQGPDFQVNTYTSGRQGHYGDFAVGPDGSGGFVVAWWSEGSYGTDTDETSIQARRFDGTGAPVGDDFQVNSYTTGFQGSLYGGIGVGPDGAGGFVVVWPNYNGSIGTDTDGGSIQARRFDATGTPLGPEFQVNTYTTGDQGWYGVAVGADGGGGFVVVWDSSDSGGTDTTWSVQARRFDATGTPFGPDFQVNTYTTGDQAIEGGVTVGPDGTGGFVVAWSSFYGPTSDDNYGLIARRFDSTGAPVGSDFLVNSYTTYSQGNNGSAIVEDGTGGFVVVWSGYGGGSDTGYGIQARRFDSAGVPIGGDFQVNTYTSLDQGTTGGVAAAPDGSGGFVILWDSQGGFGTDTSSRSIQAQRFVTSTTLGGSTTTTTTLPSLNVDVGIEATKLVVVDKLVSAGKAKAAFVAKTPGAAKGPGTDAGAIGAVLDISYTGTLNGGSAVVGQFVIPTGALSGDTGWAANKATVAKFVNKVAPGGPTGAKVAVIKPGILVKLVGKSLGDTPLAVTGAGGPDAGGVDVVYTVTNGSSTVRHCTRFAESACAYSAIAADTGAKLVCQGGMPASCP